MESLLDKGLNVRTPEDLVIPGDDPQDVNNDIVPDLDAFGTQGTHEARLAFTRRFIPTIMHHDQRAVNDAMMLHLYAGMPTHPVVLK